MHDNHIKGLTLRPDARPFSGAAPQNLQSGYAILTAVANSLLTSALFRLLLVMSNIIRYD
jgi:hypothetical protein